MRLLHMEQGLSGPEIWLVDFPLAAFIPPYAILSHTWSEDEVTLEDFRNGTQNHREGYKKIEFCGNQAARDGLRYFWVDTCCIDKSNSSELSEAINSMFRWYQNAAVCYVYLEDISVADKPAWAWSIMYSTARWFQRGWTLQELLAPKIVKFFSGEWIYMGAKSHWLMPQVICNITGIPEAALDGRLPLSSFSVEERMSWMEGRETTKPEDMAYSLLGIFGTTMPLVYGEGKRKAFIRLMEEIVKDEERRKRDEEDEDEEHDPLD